MKLFKSFELSELRHLGALGFLGFFLTPELKYFFLFYLLGFAELFNNEKKNDEQISDQSLKNYYLTLLYSQLNPMTIAKSSAQLLGQALIILKYPRGLPNAETYQNKVEYQLPFRGEWIALNGGPDKASSHSWDILTQRYAYDFVIWDENGKSHLNEGKSLEDYYCYSSEILSPADGIVVTIMDKINDYKGVGDYSIDWKTRDFRGNFVIIKHAENEYSFLAHLKKDSILVKKGDVVKAGQPIGLCGNSGHSTEPHLHFHLQDSARFWTAMGLPVRFKEFSARRSRLKEIIRTNAFVEKEEIVSAIPSIPAIGQHS